MPSFLSRYRDLLVLMFVLVGQVIGLAVQVRKPAPATDAVALMGISDRQDAKSVRLIRLWASQIVTPFEQAIHGSGQGLTGFWGNYIDLRHTREQNKELQQTIDRLRLEQASLIEDARQGQRLQGLLNFRQNYIYQTIPAQVIGTSGSLQSHVIFIDKGSADGLATDMAVVTAEGIVGKVRDVFAHIAQVLVINDQTSGAGVILETTRIRGILRGNSGGEPQVINILMDSRIQPGEKVLTAGGDQIFPRGLAVGIVASVTRDSERSGFINVVVKPAANLQHLDEVLVITSLEPHLSAQQMADIKTSEELKGAEAAADAERKKAAAEMAERLPGLKDPNAPNTSNATEAPVGPDGKTPVTPAAVAPKPLPAAHPDRFSPGGQGSANEAAPTSETSPQADDKPVQPDAKPKTKPGTQPQKPATPKPAVKPTSTFRRLPRTGTVYATAAKFKQGAAPALGRVL